MDKADLGTAIQQRRIFLSLKQEALAEMAGISAKTIYLLEQGKGNPSLDTLQKIFDVLGLELSLQIKRLDK